MTRIEGMPLASTPDGAILARFVDTHGACSYATGVLWCGIEADGRVRWIEGVRLVKGSDAIDVDGLTPAMRRMYDATCAAQATGGVLPMLVDVAS